MSIASIDNKNTGLGSEKFAVSLRFHCSFAVHHLSVACCRELIVNVGPEHVLESDRVLRAAFEPYLHLDWSVRAGDLTWSCQETLLHAADFWYAVELSSQRLHWLPPMLEWCEGLTPQEGLVAHDVVASLLAAVIRGVAPEARGHHGQPTDAEGFAAVHCDEVLIHGYDIASGLGVAFACSEGVTSSRTSRPMRRF